MKYSFSIYTGKSSFTILVMFLIFQYSWAQNDTLSVPVSNWKGTILLPSKDSILIDSLPFFENSILVQCKNKTYPEASYMVKGNYFFPVEPMIDTLYIRYRVMPNDIYNSKFRKDLSNIEHSLLYNGLVGTAYTYNPFTLNNEAFKFNDIDYSGVFSRGISVGNAQDLILNSNFNLQVNGKIGDIDIIAAISDDNTPLQPEGNTQQLQDFERIFIQFKYKNQSLIAGDYTVKSPESSYFMNYLRRLQGGQIKTDFKISSKGRLSTDASIAVSRGKFNRNVFLGEEGNQGPYRLKGANNEQFIIIIAGTERVFIDGIQLKRGADEDYIIDYNTSELIFTQKQLITKDKRIQVEFSYTDLNYLRTLATTNLQYDSKKTSIRFNFYSEQDAKNQALDGNISDTIRNLLQTSSADEFFISGINPADLSNNNGSVLYAFRDTFVNGVFYDSILVFEQTDSAIYEVKFTNVEVGGDYIRIQSAANGVVYQWVAPDPISGLSIGNFAPIQFIASPKLKQLYNIGFDHRFNSNSNLSLDLSLSNEDNNTFSILDDKNNLGLAARITYDQLVRFKNHEDSSDSGSELQLAIKAHYEYLSNDFNFIEPYRPREFSRDWNTSTLSKTSEHLYKLRLSLQNQKWGQIYYQFNGLNKDSIYNGFRHILKSDFRIKGFNLRTNSSLLQSTLPNDKSIFVRPNLDLSYTFSKWNNLKLGFYGEMEQNNQRDATTDTLTPTSLYYHFIKAYVELPVFKNIQFHLHYLRRTDHGIEASNFRVNTIADEANFSGSWIASSSSSLIWDLSYRNLQIKATELTNEDPKESYLGRLEYRLNIAKGFIRSNTIYQLGSGQQQKIDYNYVKVDLGQGTHVWEDRNGDGVEQTNEFEVANYQDQADYIRVTLLTGQFIRTNNVLFSQNISIRPSVLIRKRKKANKEKEPFILNVLKRFNSRTIFKIDRKTFDGAQDVLVFNPFQFNIEDTVLVSSSNSIINNLYFNRTELYGFEFEQKYIDNQSLLSTGLDGKNVESYTLTQRLNLKPSNLGRNLNNESIWRNLKLQFFFSIKYGKQSNNSEFFEDRNFNVEYYGFKPQLTVLWNNNFRVSFFYEYLNKYNKIGALEKLRTDDVTTEITYNHSTKTNLRFSFSYVNVDFEGDANSSVGYNMTQGLQNGTNLLWKIDLAQSLAKNIQLIIGYEGRKTGDTAPVVHVGRAEIRANF